MYFPAVKLRDKSAWTRLNSGVKGLIFPHAVSVTDLDRKIAVHVSLKKGLFLLSFLAFNEKKIQVKKVLFEKSPGYIYKPAYASSSLISDQSSSFFKYGTKGIR